MAATQDRGFRMACTSAAAVSYCVSCESRVLCTHTCVYIHTCVHTHLYIHIHTCEPTYACIHTCLHMHAGACTHTTACIHTCTYIHTCIHNTCTYTHIPAYTSSIQLCLSPWRGSYGENTAALIQRLSREKCFLPQVRSLQKTDPALCLTVLSDKF